MGLFSRKPKEYVLDRQCLCGYPYRVGYTYESGKAPKIRYPRNRQCPSCGRLRHDPGRKRGRFDPQHERGYGTQFI